MRARVDGHQSDNIHVIEGGPVTDSDPQAIVVHVRWQYVDSEAPEVAATICVPDRHGRYPIGGCEWTWYAALPSQDDYPLTD
ncbi:hypothetical protein QMK19_35155 [Streptomyces sp. H10-C2]|uniref:hypothetical protein n=1 Tax=unclassified Streptomyces TaxID=2593676 RepID=UPI0024B8882E|nr:MULTISPECIES: hypothetical protein [unclassified Streptomyces]MDJ0345873.1 hypothetical protein [Streptomyces sp. PH10-H1]MDJ0374722.1 hypothetical protein [Streptomyces sp. H10-C2]